MSNLTCIITGISKGIGEACAKLLLERGHTVIGWGMNPPAWNHSQLHFHQTDVRSRESVEKSWADSLSVLGTSGPDVLINNAGLGYFGYFEDYTEEQFREIFEVNVHGIWHTCRLVIPAMKARGHGHIINISSTAGLEGMAQVAAYCGAKHAVRGITESLFKELREFGIKVTGVYPGSVRTDFFRNSPGIKPHDKMLSPDEVGLQIVQAIETSPNFAINSLEFRPLKVK